MLYMVIWAALMRFHTTSDVSHDSQVPDRGRPVPPVSFIQGLLLLTAGQE